MSSQPSQPSQSSQPSQPSQPCEPCEPPKKSEKQLALVESLMQHIESFQSGAANEMTYLSAMNALRDLHAYVKKAEKMQEAAILLITIDGEEFFVEEYQDVRIAIRFSDNYAFSSDTGDFVGVWNEETRTLTELSLDDEQ
jgi:hypothetical protein